MTRAARRSIERDIALMRKRWLVTLDHDPCYNPNLSLKRWHEFELASPPRTVFASSDGALSSAAVGVADRHAVFYAPLT